MNRRSRLWIPLIRRGWISCKQFVLLRLCFQASCCSGWIDFRDSSVSVTQNSTLLGIKSSEVSSYLTPQCIFLSGKRIENFQEFQSSFEDTYRKGAFFCYMSLFTWNSTSGTVICYMLYLTRFFFFSPFSSAIGSSFHMGGAAPWLSWRHVGIAEQSFLLA